MSHNKLKQSDSSGSTIDSIIKNANKLHSVIQLQANDEGVTGEHTRLRALPTFKSIGVKMRGEEEETFEMEQNSGGTGVERSKSLPTQPPPDLVNPIRKLQIALRRLKRKVKYMKRLQLDVDKQLDLLDDEVKNVQHSILKSEDLTDITTKVLNLIRKVPVSVSSEKQKQKNVSTDDQDGDKSHRRIFCLPGIHEMEEDLKRLAVFRDVLREFEDLSEERKICLLSFAVFPENQAVNRKMLMYWWIGEGILTCEPKPEDVVKDILDDFTERNLIEPVENKRKVEPSSYKMTPFVHASVVLISKEIGLFNMYDKKEKPSMKQSELHKVCLVEGSSSQQEAKAKKMPHVDQINMYHKGEKPRMRQSALNKVCLVEGSSSEPKAEVKRMSAENMETVFNVSEMFPEFTCKWFTRMKKLRVLYLGRWERIDPEIEMDSWERTNPEIEMDSRRVMKNLSSLTTLRFLSFQGISTIKSLSRSACKIKKLIILDLRHCYNLEQLPDDIHKLKNLVYLDLTGCEALECVPVGLAGLDNLEVLKGFVLGDVDTANTCKLKTLKRLVNLRKLSVIVHQQDFGLHELILDITDFKYLEKLKVRWGSKVSLKTKQPVKQPVKQPRGAAGILERAKTRVFRGDPEDPVLKLPTMLRKLDLQRFPDKELPKWLWPQNLIYLEKLHLGSSKRLKGFGALPGEPTKCRVKVLRLTSLLKLKVEWRDMKKLYFPNLILLESYECPRVTFCPCDRNGIWRSEKITDKKDDSTTTL